MQAPPGCFEALADPTRRAVFERLRAGPRCVGDLTEGLGVSRPAVSQHLKVLREARLVAERRCGRQRVYRIEPAGLAELRRYLEGFWDGALGSFQDFVASEGREADGSSQDVGGTDRPGGRAGAKVRRGRLQPR